jgi:hypothetical protein
MQVTVGTISRAKKEVRNIKRFIVRADEMLTAFVELQRAIHECAVGLVL